MGLFTKKDNKKTNKGNYLTIKESRQIIKYNIKQMKYYEGLKNRKLSLDEYTSVMKDENNVVEIDDFSLLPMNIRYYICDLSISTTCPTYIGGSIRCLNIKSILTKTSF